MIPKLDLVYAYVYSQNFNIKHHFLAFNLIPFVFLAGVYLGSSACYTKACCYFPEFKEIRECTSEFPSEETSSFDCNCCRNGTQRSPRGRRCSLLLGFL